MVRSHGYTRPQHYGEECISLVGCLFLSRSHANVGQILPCYVALHSNTSLVLLAEVLSFTGNEVRLGDFSIPACPSSLQIHRH